MIRPMLEFVRKEREAFDACYCVTVNRGTKFARVDRAQLDVLRV
jgi:hypothetical protein